MASRASTRAPKTPPAPPGSTTVTVTPPAPQAAEDEDLYLPDRSPGFWELVDSIAEGAWWSGIEGEKGYKVYLYRDNPRANTKGSGYKLLITEPFDIEWVKKRLGGYDYRAMLNDPSGQIVKSIQFSIDAPPKEADQAPAPAASNPAGSPDFQSQVIQLMREQATRTEALLTRVLESQHSPAAAAVIDPNVALKGVVEMFSNIAGRAQGPSLADLIALVKQLTPQTPDLLTILAKAREAGLIPAASGGLNLVEQLDTLLEVAKKLNTGEGGGQSIWELLVNKAPELLTGFGNIVANAAALQERRQAARPPAPAPGPAAPGPPAPAPQMIPPPAAAAAPPVHPGGTLLRVQPITIDAPPAEATAPGPAPGEAPGDDQVQQITPAEFDALRRKIATAIARNVDGADIVGFMEVEAPAVLANFYGASVTQLEQFFLADPILSKAAACERFKAVLAEMVETLNPPTDADLDPGVQH